MLNFLRVLTQDLKERLGDVDKDGRNFLRPENALNKKFHCTHPNLDKVFNDFPFKKLDEETRTLINQEWALLLEYELGDEITNEDNVEIFWTKLSSCFGDDGQRLFEHLKDFAISLMLISNSNASAERLWSKMNLSKTKLRNKLKFETIRSILLASSYIVDNGGIQNFEATDKLIMKVFKMTSKRKGKKRKHILDTEASCKKLHKRADSKKNQKTKTLGQTFMGYKTTTPIPNFNMMGKKSRIINAEKRAKRLDANKKKNPTNQLV